MYALYGLAEDDSSPLHDRWVGSLHADDRARVEWEFAQAVSGSAAYDTEFRVVWPNGEVHHIRAMARVLSDGAGAAQQAIGTARGWA